MYSNEIEETLKECNYSLTIQELNELMAHSPQCKYEIISMTEFVTKVKIKFTDHVDIEITVVR